MKRLLAILLLTASLSSAQCVMCYRTAAAQNSARSQVMNMGIFILGVPPFVILGGFLLLCWRRSRTYADYADQYPEERTEEEERRPAA
jgi:hypothetical protein